jgi:hypothetical protein
VVAMQRMVAMQIAIAMKKRKLTGPGESLARKAHEPQSHRPVCATKCAQAR